MKCSEIENKLIAYIEGDLTIKEAQSIEKHIDHCEDCKQELIFLKQMLGGFEAIERKQPSDKVRTGFLASLEEEKLLISNVVALKNENVFPWKTAFQIAASVLLLIGGYAFGSFRESVKSTSQIAVLQEETSELKQNVMLAMLDNKSASKRIQAVNFSEDIVMPETKVLSALIDRLHYDGNINVRIAAAEALSKYSENMQVKDAFIKSLTLEKNPNIQIAVIQFLVKVQDKRALVPMRELLDQTETPNYVKEQVNEGIQKFI